MVTTILVYSLSSNTRRVADTLAAELEAGLAALGAPQVRASPAALGAPQVRASPWAILRLSFATILGGYTPVQVNGPDPTLADLLILAAPV
jgi:hypothetical protein